MTRTVVMAINPMEPSSWTRHDVEDPLEFIADTLGEWPENARLYNGSVCASRDVTPETAEDVLALQGMEGPFFVVEYPSDLVTVLIIAVVAVAALAAVVFLLRPSVPNMRPGSANNELSGRTNEARIGGRIPDIFGRVRAYPDLLTVPYKFFENNQEIEQSYMCVGRGAYDIEQVRDGDTLIQSIAGTSASFWGPGTSPNSGDAPFMSVGTPVTDPVLSVTKMNDVNGQTLRPPNSNFVKGDGDIRFVYPDTIERTGSEIDFTANFENGDTIVVEGASYAGGASGTQTVTSTMRFELGGTIRFSAFDPSTVFAAGQFVTLTNASYAGNNSSGGTLFVDLYGTYEVASVTSSTIVLVSASAVNADWTALGDYPADRTEYKTSVISKPVAGAGGVDLAGTYTVLSVSAGQLVLSNPVLVNADWGTPLQSLPGSATPAMSPSISTTGVSWIGPFVVDLDGLDRVMSNFIAQQGLYNINNKGKQRPNYVTVEVEATPVDLDDVATGPAETFSLTLAGEGDSKDSVGATMWAVPTFTGRCKVRARRTTPTNRDWEGTWVDEVKWRDCYGMAKVPLTEFGDVTTVMAKTYGTAGATSLKERKLSVVATRRLPRRELDGSFSTELYATTDMADIVSFMCTDPRIGRRPSDQVDVGQVYETRDAIVAHFGISDAAQFCYTFDQAETTFQDTLSTVAVACFSTCYRRGNVIRLKFEAPTEDSVLLFNHRNKLPGTEARTTQFGTSSEYDGVALEYSDPIDGARLTLYVPQGNESALNPKKVTTQGVASHKQAHLLAWRAWNRIVYQTTTVEFDGLPEADLLVQTDRILVADNTRPDTVDGEVESQDVLKLRLSQRAALKEGVGYTIFLQGGGTGVDAMAVYPITDKLDADFGDPHVVLLERAPAIDLVLDDESDFRSTYAIVGPGFERTARVFLLSEKEPQDDGTIKLTAVNYDARYYANDGDFLN